MKRVIFAICLMLIVSVGGCPPTINREQWIKAGYDSNYVDGYEDGQYSGYVAAGHPYSHFQKNTYRYENDSQYRQGWNDGFAVAKGSYESIGRSLHHY
jgi:hypothetical protein